MSDNQFEISGEVIFVGQPEFIAENFSKRILVIRVSRGEYDTEPSFEFINRNMSKLDGLEQGDRVLVSFQIGGKKKADAMKWFQNMEGRHVEKL
jgi:hypothetical protein